MIWKSEISNFVYYYQDYFLITNQSFDYQYAKHCGPLYLQQIKNLFLHCYFLKSL